MDESCVLVEGPWTHRSSAPTAAGSTSSRPAPGPLVLFLHGFPEFWWAWHAALPAVADAGFRAVAVDLRGYGASDKPPRGYDGYTLAADVAGLIRALGERYATVVGAGLGGMIGLDGGGVPPAAGPPAGGARRRRTRCGCGPAIFADPRGQLAAAAPLLRFQLPRYEHVLTRDDAALVGELPAPLGRAGVGAGPRFADVRSSAAGRRCGSRRPRSARWRATAGRSGRRCGCTATGSSSCCSSRSSPRRCNCTGRWTPRSLPRTAQGSGRYVIAPYEWRLLRRRRPLPTSGAARPGHRRDPALGQGLTARRAVPAPSDALLAQVGHLGRRRPPLVDAEVELLQAERPGDRRLAAGVLHAQPVVVLGRAR